MSTLCLQTVIVLVTTTFSNSIHWTALFYQAVRPVREHGTAIDCDIDHSGQLETPYMTTVEPLYCGHLGDLVQCPV